ncbi:MAG TPA: hypothetical protein VMB51_08210 [Solirubrobacteraceae bacterium]|nr:hypothetical protein [Solirubrobacteraceae bacterium]
MRSLKLLPTLLLCSCLLALACASAAQAYEHTCETARTGSEQDWSSPQTWTCEPGAVHAVPGASDSATIKAGAQLVTGSDRSVGQLVLQPGGALDLYGSTLTAGSAVIGTGADSTDATLESLMGTGTLETSALAQFGNASIANVDVRTTGGDTVFESDAPETVSSTWTQSQLTVTAGQVTFAGAGAYDLNGVSPTFETSVNVGGIDSIPETLTLDSPASLMFQPSAAGSGAGASMLTLGGLDVSGSVSVATAFSGFTPSAGERFNLLSAPAAGIAALTATNTSTQTYATDEAGARLYDSIVTPEPPPPAPKSPPSLTLGQVSPAKPHAGEIVTIAIATEAGATVTCAVNGLPAPCTAGEIKFTAPEDVSAAVEVTASNAAGSTSAERTIAIPWLPALVSLSPFETGFFGVLQLGRIVWENEPANSIECSRIPGIEPANPEYGWYVGVMYGYNPVSGFYPDMLYGCDGAENRLEWGAGGDVTATEAEVVPTTYGTFTMWVSATALSHGANWPGLTPPPPEPGGVLEGGPLTCPTFKGAQGYVWVINGKLKTTTSPTLPAGEVPANGTVTCGAIGPFGIVMSASVIVYKGVRVAASSTVEESSGGSAHSAVATDASTIRKHRRHKRHDEHPQGHVRTVALTVKASGRAKLEVRAFNTTTTGVGKAAKTTYKLVYHKRITVEHGSTKVHFGAKLHTSEYEIVVRPIHVHTIREHGKRHRKTTYGKALVVT